MLNILSLLSISIHRVIHVGAHFGEEVPTYLALGANDIRLFEPVKAHYERLVDTVVGGEVKAYNLALGSKESTMEMWIASNEGHSSSLLTPKVHKKQYPHIKFNRKELVPVTTLNNAIQLRHFDLLSMDVQGYELEVLKGATEHLLNLKAIITEVNRAELYEGCAHVLELDTFLADYHFVRILTDWNGTSWGNALYVKSTDLSRK